MSTIPPHIAITYQPKSRYASLKRETPPATEDPPMADPTPTSADRMALAVCTYNPLYPTPCQKICNQCRKQAAAVAHEIARQLRQRHGGSSTTADWLDGVGCHA